jgi:hypothetical protein
MSEELYKLRIRYTILQQVQNVRTYNWSSLSCLPRYLESGALEVFFKAI